MTGSTPPPGQGIPWAKIGKTALAVLPLLISGTSLYFSRATYDQTHTSDRATIAVSADQLTSDAAENHKWTETIDGSGFNGDTAVYIYYPGQNSLQPAPSAVASIRDCPEDRVKVELNNGNFTAKAVAIPDGFNTGTYNIYAEGVNSSKKVFYPITIGKPAPASAPLSSSNPSKPRCLNT